MTQPTLTDNQRAIIQAIGEGFAEALQPLTVLLRGELSATRIACEELVAAVDRLTAVVAAQAAGDIDPDDAPDVEMPIERFHSFDWAQIGAQVLIEDEFGPAIVSYGGKAFKRRAPDNAYGAAVWYSRCIGKNDDGTNKYVRLITFKTLSDKVEPMGRKVERAVTSAPAQPPAVAQQRPPAPARQPAPAPGPAAAAPVAAHQPTLTDEPEWPDHEPTAEEEFNSWPSGSDGKPPLQPRQQPTGPRVSSGAARDDKAAPAAPAAATTGSASPRPPTPAAPASGRRQATIGGGEVYAAFTKWAVEFARRYPHYRASASDRPNYYGIQCSMYARGAADDGTSKFSHVKDLPLLEEAIAAMEKHAAANHAN